MHNNNLKIYTFSKLMQSHCTITFCHFAKADILRRIQPFYSIFKLQYLNQKAICTRFIYSLFCSKELWTYRFSVISTELCPRSSLSALTSNPSLIQFEAKMWRSAWKCTDGNFAFFKIVLNRYCIALGSIGLFVPVRTYSSSFPLNFSKKSIMQSGIGICLREDSLFGSVIMSLVLLVAVGDWLRCMVFLTVKIRFSKTTWVRQKKSVKQA